MPLWHRDLAIVLNKKTYRKVGVCGMKQKNKKANCILSFSLTKKEDLQTVMGDFQKCRETYVINEKVFFDLKLCLEEAITNIFSHGYKQAQKDTEVSLHLYKTSDGFMADIVDNGNAFNPCSDFNPTHLEINWKARPVGGLGIHLLKNLSDELEYIPQQNGNRLKIYKKT